MQGLREAFIQRFASPASLGSDDMLQQKHQAALLEMADRHFKALQPLWDMLLFRLPVKDKHLQHEVSIEA